VALLLSWSYGLFFSFYYHSRGLDMNFYYITRTGIALDDFGNEIRDENGQIIIVPKNQRAFYDIGYKADEIPDDDD
jgi:hypothetical protein